MIRITRINEYSAVFRSYKIYIDEVCHGKIKVGETQEFEIGNGSHTVYAKLDWGRSNKLCVNVSDSIVDLEVGCNLAGWRWVLWRLYATVWAHKYLWLREKKSVDEPPEDVK